jgi:hypothetical protein
VLQVRGTGVYVNVGRSLRFDDYSSILSQMMLLDVVGADAKNYLCSYASKSGYDSIQFARRGIPSEGSCLNTSRCAAVKRTLPVLTALEPSLDPGLLTGWQPPELIICGGGCMTEPVGDAAPHYP